MDRFHVGVDQVLLVCEGLLEQRRDDIEIDLEQRCQRADVGDVLHQDTGACAIEMLVTHP